MGLTLQDIHDCRSGYRKTIIVGELPDVLRQSLKLKVPLVHLSIDGLAHINKEHPKITDYDLPHIPHVIESGLLLQEMKKPKVVLAIGKDKGSHRYFIAAMKIVASYELWLSSFYQIRQTDIGRHRRRSVVLREPVDSK